MGTALCLLRLFNWIARLVQKKKSSMPFAVPMIWKEPSNHVDDCYFYIVNISGFSGKNKRSIQYPNLDSARRPVKHEKLLLENELLRGQRSSRL